MTLMKPVLEVTKFDFVYFFEDCCGSNGPLFSPAIYKQIYEQANPEEVRAYLTELKKETDKGGYIPIPDHRIPPDISLKNMQDYIEIFHQVFG